MNLLKLEEYAALAREQKIVIDIHDKPTTTYHQHDFLELTYVCSGSANHMIESVSTILSEGDYFIVDYNKRHQYVQIGDVPFRVMNCLFVPQLIDETLKDCRELKEVIHNYLIKFDFYHLKGHPSDFVFHDETGYIRNLFQYLYEEYTQKETGYLESMRCHLILILIEMMRKIKLPNPSDTASKMICQITDYVQHHFSEKLSLSMFAKEFNYSLAHISHGFKHEIGMTFQEYVQSIRIQESCRLLMNTNKKVSDIASLVGYTDIKFFNELFKRQMDMTPRQFRKKH